MSASVLDGILACPRCGVPLALPEPETAPVCVCGASYAWSAGVPDLTPVPPPKGRVGDRWGLWERLQANGAAAYEADPVSSLSVGDRVDARLFGAFADLRGRVLDVGCGPQGRPSYVPQLPGVELVGIDPLRGAPVREFTFVQGLGEYLPFVAASFDRVLFATSLDHLLDPERALRESARVVSRDGRVVVWCGLPGRSFLPAPLGALARRALEATRSARGKATAAAAPTPAGAVDAYHFEHPDLPQVEAWLKAAGLCVVERTRLSEPTNSAFLAAAPG